MLTLGFRGLDFILNASSSASRPASRARLSRAPHEAAPTGDEYDHGQNQDTRRDQGAGNAYPRDSWTEGQDRGAGETPSAPRGHPAGGDAGRVGLASALGARSPCWLDQEEDGPPRYVGEDRGRPGLPHPCTRRRKSLERQITEEVRALARLDLNGLRVVWRDRFGEPPALRSADLLRRNLAWRIQAGAFGGLDAETEAAVGRTPKRLGPVLTPGMRLAREWRGVVHEVEILDGAVLYGGQRFDSLSKVARHITGVRWNGPRFFGLRQSAKASDNV